MKSSFKLLTGYSFMLFACNSSSGDKVKDFIPGTYARHYQDEYTDSYDTIEIKPATTSGSEGFEIKRRSAYRKKTDNGFTDMQTASGSTLATYDEKTKTLILGPGKAIYFDPEKAELKMGAEPYKKLGK